MQCRLMSMKFAIYANDVLSQVYIKRHMWADTYFIVSGGSGAYRINLLKLLNGVLLPFSLLLPSMACLFFY